MVSLLSSQPLSWGLGLEEEGHGAHTGTHGGPFFNSLKNHLNYLFLTEASPDRASRIIEKVLFGPNNLISELIVDKWYAFLSLATMQVASDTFDAPNPTVNQRCCNMSTSFTLESSPNQRIKDSPQSESYTLMAQSSSMFKRLLV